MVEEEEAVMAEKKKRPSALSTSRRLSEGEVLNTLYGTGPAGAGALSTRSRLLALARSEAERHATLRRIALEYLGIDTDDEGWEGRYMACLEEEAFPGFRLAVGPGKGKVSKEDDSTRLLVVARLLQIKYDPTTGEEMTLVAKAKELARSFLSAEDLGRRRALDAETKRLIRLFRHWQEQTRKRRPG